MFFHHRILHGGNHRGGLRLGVDQDNHVIFPVGSSMSETIGVVFGWLFHTG